MGNACDCCTASSLQNELQSELNVTAPSKLAEPTEVEEKARDVSEQAIVPNVLVEKLSDQPNTLGSEFTVLIEEHKPHSLGIDLDVIDGVTARVVKIHEIGEASAWNSRAMTPEDLRIKEGDYIVAVNGQRGNVDKMTQVLRKDNRLDMRLVRPWEFKVNASKTGGASLGIELGFGGTADCLLIKSVAAGSIQDWNMSHADLAVKCRDRIVEINGVRGHHTRLAKEIRTTDGELQITFSRCGR